MHITIEYHAILREQRGLDSEIVEVAHTSLRELYDNLRHTFTFSLARQHVRPAVNDQFCHWDRQLSHGDRVVFVPPTSGG
ncbi:MAG: MoaD/ThiS family protein [Polyangia bacterium]|jgi:molybdopterin synthase sulfur carrier subunit/molybdopterin-guanine dinucleotide biosynthesis protein A